MPDAAPERPAFGAGAAGRVSAIARFALPSALGLYAFFWPVEYAGRTTIPLDVLTRVLGSLLGARANAVVGAVCMLTAIATLAVSFGPAVLRTAGGARTRRLQAVFTATPGWAALRVVGGVTAGCFLAGTGPGWLTAEPIARTALETVGVPVLLIFVTSCFVLPLITDYGLMEFSGVLTRPFFQRVFGLPGRASLDALASWVSSGPVAVLITLRQFNAGFYTAREALTIICNFSVVSVPFSLVIAQVAQIGDHYFAWYLSLVVIGVVLALITPRLPPLSRLPALYVGGLASSGASLADASRRRNADPAPLLRTALDAAVGCAAHGRGPRAYLIDTVATAFETVFGLVAACVGTVVLANLVLEYTPLFGWLSRPLQPLLALLGVGEAAAAAPGLLVGFLDQFLTTLVAIKIQNPHTRFVLAGLSVAQVVYLSNFGVILLRSALPITLRQLAGVFAIRTALATPLLVLAARIVLGPP